MVGSTVIAVCLMVAAGCQSSGGGGGDTGILQAGVPPKAQQVQEGSGQLVYAPEQTGRLYLYDATGDQVVERYQVRQGQRFAVDAALGRATLAGNEVSVGKLKKGATYRLYFLPDAARSPTHPLTDRTNPCTFK